LRIDTASEARTITLGDYDGNGIADIAYTEAVGSHQRLMISYGTADRPLAPIEVGEFPSIIGVTRIQLADSIDQLSLAADSRCCSRRPAGSRRSRCCTAAPIAR